MRLVIELYDLENTTNTLSFHAALSVVSFCSVSFQRLFLESVLVALRKTKKKKWTREEG